MRVKELGWLLKTHTHACTHLRSVNESLIDPLHRMTERYWYNASIVRIKPGAGDEPAFIHRGEFIVDLVYN